MRSETGDGTLARGRVIAVVSAASILGWAVPAILMLGKGFTVQDEGTYVLSYRWWSTNPYFVSGAQYVYGPIFEALGESISALRLLRLAMVLGANAWFAWSFVAWLEDQRGEQPRSAHAPPSSCCSRRAAGCPTSGRRSRRATTTSPQTPPSPLSR